MIPIVFQAFLLTPQMGVVVLTAEDSLTAVVAEDSGPSDSCDEAGTKVRLFVNCSGLMKSYNLERTKLVLFFLMFKAMRILVLKFSKFRKQKAFRLMTLMRLFVASSFAFE